MELRIWDYEKDNNHILSFLNGMSIAHNEERKDEDWFHWKFEKSPYGKAILACAFDGETVAGCVAYGMGKISLQNKEYKAALSYETFVHPNYQRRGLFKKLIDLAEEEAKSQGVSFLYNFPNSNSIQGFRHMGWICRNDIEQFRIKIVRPISTLTHLLDLKKGFEPNPSNLEIIRNEKLDDTILDGIDSQIIVPVWTKEYLRWRFFTYPNREYYVINDEDVFSIAMIGKRGRLKNAHILCILSKKRSISSNNYANKVLKEICRKIRPHIITYSNSNEDNTFPFSKGFFKVPSHSNFCYKVLDEDFPMKTFRIMLPSINAHTY